ncbi:molecular chaperone TorD family protein [Actinomyces sp.]|uniref:TorD/DmsD family molecular chaperone n=1 Tax=Actinomyces sp. TaxID=29317 RepID=UPI00290DB72C|nr:molecular chaperone TorD family protein [Actinomyces sp.]MDU5568889.1 molecular chaperone TorD family protein [Actinomyces sp.]
MTVSAVEQAERISAAGKVLSQLYLSAPAEQLREAMYSPQMLNDWPLTDSNSIQGVRTLLSSRPESEEEIKRDHLYLFVGAGRALAQPYESVRTSEEGLVFEEETFAVRAAYARFGLRAPNFNREPDDHIGLEIAFLSDLAERAAERLEAGEDAEEIRLAMRDFLFDHLDRFAGGVVEDVRKHAKTALYKAVAEFTLGFIASVHAFVETEGANAAK